MNQKWDSIGKPNKLQGLGLSTDTIYIFFKEEV